MSSFSYQRYLADIMAEFILADSINDQVQARPVVSN